MEQVDPKVLELFRLNGPVFQALGDTARQDIVLLLAYSGRMNVGQIAEYSPLSRPAVSHHLKVLKDAGLVTVEKEGTERYYAFAGDAALNNLAQLVESVRGCMSNE